MWLFAVFVAIPLIEIALFIQVGGLIGLAMYASNRPGRRRETTQEVHRTADGGQVVHTEHRV